MFDGSVVALLYYSGDCRRGYIIVDSDDNTEAIVSSEQLEYYINIGLSIRGIETSGRCPHKVIHTESRYVFRNKATEAKMMCLIGAYVVVNGTRVVEIKARGKRTDPPVVLKLSEFANNCGDLSFNFTEVHRPIVIVLDDNIKFVADNIPNLFRYKDVKLDIRDVTKKGVVRDLYKKFYSFYNHRCLSKRDLHNRLKECVIDDYARMHEYEVKLCRFYL